MFLGKSSADWVDICCLMQFRGNKVESLKDLIKWSRPETPEESLYLAFELLEARKKYLKTAAPFVSDLISTFEVENISRTNTQP